MVIFDLTFLQLILIGVLLILFCVHLYCVLFIHLYLLKFKAIRNESFANKPLSVIIAARNEAENLSKNLKTILEQNYPEFEVIVVNDRSTDDTADILRELSSQYKQLKTVTINHKDSFLAGKKFAVAMGIKAAKNDWLVFTDADCVPNSNDWLKWMQEPSNSEKKICLGYSPYRKQKGLLNALIRFETFFTAVNYLSFALKKNPYMGVGRNMAYQKQLFFKNKGFASHMHIPSGDDDLFINENATSDNVEIQILNESFVWTEAKSTWVAYLKQKKRHFGAGKHYKTKHKIVLTTQISIQFCFYGLLIALAIYQPTQQIALIVLISSILIRSLIYPRLLKRMAYSDLRWWFPVLDIILILFLVFNAFLSIFVKKVQWK